MPDKDIIGNVAVLASFVATSNLFNVFHTANLSAANLYVAAFCVAAAIAAALAMSII